MARSTRARACDGKVRYEDRASAQAALDSLARGTGARWHRLNAYVCRFCKGWHVGHKPRYRGQR